MTINKAALAKNISNKIDTSSEMGKEILESFLNILKKSYLNNKKIKIHKFGTFFKKTSPERIGRNPKTNESYIISVRNKLYLSVSNNIKKELN